MSKTWSAPVRAFTLARIASLDRSAPKITFCTWILSRRPRLWISSAKSSAIEAVQHRTVVLKSARNWSWRSMFPGPAGIASAPKRSQPSWNPTPAVQTP
jgi:hypothetical protein